jgi:hypothetical protein
MLKSSLLLAGVFAGLTPVLFAQSGGAKTRVAVVGLNHDHVWGLLEDMPKEADAELVAIADPNPELTADPNYEPFYFTQGARRSGEKPSPVQDGRSCPYSNICSEDREPYGSVVPYVRLGRRKPAHVARHVL